MEEGDRLSGGGEGRTAGRAAASSVDMGSRIKGRGGGESERWGKGARHLLCEEARQWALILGKEDRREEKQSRCDGHTTEGQCF